MGGMFSWCLTELFPLIHLLTCGCRRKSAITQAVLTPGTGKGECSGPHHATFLSRLPFLAELLESGISPQRVPNGVEPKKGRRNWRLMEKVLIGRSQQLGESRDRTVL